MSGHKIAFLFPGQGSQSVGMGQDLFRAEPAARALLDAASQAAGEDLETLVLRGPFDTLSRTRVLQPAITAVNLACLDWLLAHGVRPWAVAGHSLGEYAALAAANVIPAADAVRLAAVRGRAMDDAATANPGTMVAVVGLDAGAVVAAMADLMPRAEGGVANLNGPDQVVVSGTTAAMDRAVAHFEALGARCVPLAVSGAWHSELMRPAEPVLRAALDGVALADPSCRLYVNVTGAPATTAGQVRDALIAQLAAPVRWVDTVCGLIADGVDRFVEVGPGKVLRGTLRRIWPDATAYEVHSAGDVAALQRVVDALAG